MVCNDALYLTFRKISYLARKFDVKFSSHEKPILYESWSDERYIGFSGKFNMEFMMSGYEFSLSHSLLWKWKKTRFHLSASECCNIQNILKKSPFSLMLYSKSRQGETWPALSKRKNNVFVFSFMDDNNGFENKIKRSLFLIFFEYM